MTDTELDQWIAYFYVNGPHDYEIEMLRLINEVRAQYDLNTLVQNETLMLAARFKAQAMHDMGYFSHTNPVYGAFYNITIELFGFNAAHLSENIARGQRTPQQAMADLMASPTHRQAILNPEIEEVGVGFFGGRYWTQKFGISF